MIALFIMIKLCYGQTSTTINTCSNEKKVLKLDVRQRVRLLAQGSTIEDLDAFAICKEAYQYDYIWLHQLWTPSKYNYKNVNGTPQQTDDYRELQNIKEYLIDPSLGSLTNLYKFQQNVKNFCLHIKFLGEFSFYVPKDSYLIQNRTRFFQRPMSENPNIYSNRYDKDRLVWAMNDQMKTVPYAIPWNYLTLKGVQDMQDIIYRLIITQHRLDGVVFLQPSLGLYNNVYINFYNFEINDQANKFYLKDFYWNIKLESMSSDLYFMGGEDNSQYKSKLLNYLQQIYNQPTAENNWINMNYTFDSQNNITLIDDKSVKGTKTYKQTAVVDQFMDSTKNTCIRFNFTNYDGGAAGIDQDRAKRGVYVVVDGYTYNNFYKIHLQDNYTYSDTDNRRNESFNFSNKDIVEVQFEPDSYLIRFKKLESNLQASTYMDQEPEYENIRFTGIVTSTTSILQIAFPFMFSSKYKHSYLSLFGHRHIKLTINDPDNFYFAQVEPSINQEENNFTLNFYTLTIPSSSQIGLGVCDRDRLEKKNHQSISASGLGAYMLYSNGSRWHNSSANVQTGKEYDQSDLISVTYRKSNKSISYYKNKVYLYSFSLSNVVKNLNFCVSMIASDHVLRINQCTYIKIAQTFKQIADEIMRGFNLSQTNMKEENASL
ncbi:hypothetical protein pb186bvf_005196 [Paramecium bursaria]